VWIGSPEPFELDASCGIINVPRTQYADGRLAWLGDHGQCAQYEKNEEKKRVRGTTGGKTFDVHERSHLMGRYD
jgi:hypothetical protein